MTIIAKDYFNQNKIVYKPFENNINNNTGNLRFHKNSHCLVVNVDGISRISRVNATKVS
jgi:hypothetical protein